VSYPPAARVYPDRTARGDRHRGNLARPVAAGRPEGARGRQPHTLPEQPEADRPGHAPVPRRRGEIPPADLLETRECLPLCEDPPPALPGAGKDGDPRPERDPA